MRHAGTGQRVDAIVVNWNGRRYLPDCLRALANSDIPVRVIVVDCASQDGSVEYLQAKHRNIEVVALRENIGYAGGANAGLQHGRCPYAIVMNPDVILAQSHLSILLQYLESDPAIGAAQGKLYRITPEQFRADLDAAARLGLDSAGHFIRRSRMVIDRGQGVADSPRYNVDTTVFSACGAALFLRRSMLEDIAPDGEYFDPDFFAYKEDIDLCWRARLLGWDIRFVPAAIAYHVRGWAGKGTPPKSRIPLEARRHSWKNHYLLMLKNDRLGDMLRSAPAILGWELVRQGYALLRDPLLYGSYLDLIRLLPSALRKRRELMARARAKPAELRRWFGAPRSGLAPSEALRVPASTSERG